ncbi:MAG: DEAD/DEAH box helicase [Hyphomicrobiales bacterium]|nr:DEAD/DEAH box helicase [Hyphomicrobiales bacterium]
MSFAELGLAEPIGRALKDARYSTPTPIQAAAIPLVGAGRHLIGIAQTGTGKTAAFALPILNRLAAAPKPAAPKHCRVLVLSPTRELSGQIADAFTIYGRHLPISVRLVIGGVPIRKQIRAVSAGADIVVATPGRLIDLTGAGALKLDAVDVLVLDEADRMLDMGFIRDIRRIIAKLPPERQTLMFSATMAPDIARLADEILVEPETIRVAPPATTAALIDQQVVHVARGDKPEKLATMLKDEPIERALVFTRTKHGADKVARKLAKAGTKAAAIHGNKSQGQRERALASFRSGRVPVLIATDIAARGIDVAGITHVINYELPNVPETYVHRIGRTGRAGAAGVAISLCSADEVPFLRAIERLIRSRIAAEGDMPVEETTAASTNAPGNGARPARGGSKRRRPPAWKSRSKYRGPNRDGGASAKGGGRQRSSRPATGEAARR